MLLSGVSVRVRNVINRGKVYIVGAGPGHPELLTLKAAELLRTGDVIVYDRLIQAEVLALTKPSAERIYMGKPLGRHDSRQDEIHDLLVRKAREGKIVVRLKGGDPFVFGRGGEEAEYLADHGIPFEVVPGVSSALAAPLSAGIAVTHRDIASAVAFVTGHEAKEEQSRLDWGALGKLDTLVFLMGVHNVGRIAGRLMAHGRDPQTPAAMVQMAFWHDERVVAGTLADIAARVEEAGVKPPATLVIGEVVRLHEKLRQSQRDLQRRPDGSSHFEPAPAPDQVLRLATGGLGSQVLRFALTYSLFDRLAEWTLAAPLAESLHLDAAALGEMLECLVAAGLLESGEQGFRNLELASRYLCDASPRSLKPAVLQLAAAGEWPALLRYATQGSPGDAPQAREEEWRRDACESLARLAAPTVADKLPLEGCRSFLLVGWGEASYRETVSRRSPAPEFEARNPFLGASLTEEGRLYDVILLSGLLASCARGQVEELLKAAAARLSREGLLALCDTFLPAGCVPPPEVVLGALGRRLQRAGCRNWSVGRLHDALDALGFHSVQFQALPGGSTLAIARRG
ncbi:MAG: uroporphyrinogen-III C-methyltransferase [Acidobacteria bacterium]|nr:uroporphyrinogen-III C-methyltransferase [Acidobacteriota bacterium]